MMATRTFFDCVILLIPFTKYPQHYWGMAVLMPTPLGQWLFLAAPLVCLGYTKSISSVLFTTMKRKPSIVGAIPCGRPVLVVAWCGCLLLWFSQSWGLLLLFEVLDCCANSLFQGDCRVPPKDARCLTAIEVC